MPWSAELNHMVAKYNARATSYERVNSCNLYDTLVTNDAVSGGASGCTSNGPVSTTQPRGVNRLPLYGYTLIAP